MYIHVNYKYCTIKTYEDWVTLMYPPLIQAFCFMFLYAEMQGIKHLLTKFWMMIFFISDRSMPLNKITNFKRWPVSRLIVTILAPESGSLGSFQGSYVLVSPREPSFFRMLSMNNPLYQRLVLKKLIKTSLYLFIFLQNIISCQYIHVRTSCKFKQFLHFRYQVITCVTLTLECATLLSNSKMAVCIASYKSIIPRPSEASNGSFG